MARTQSDIFTPIELGPDDQALVDAYNQVGVPLDRLPHSPDIGRLVKFLGKKGTESAKFLVYQRLLTLRQMGMISSVPRTALLRTLGK